MRGLDLTENVRPLVAALGFTKAFLTLENLDSQIIEQAPDAIIFSDTEGIIRVWNRSAELLFGYTSEEAIGKDLNIIVPEASRKAHWAGFNKAIEKGEFKNEAAIQKSQAATKSGEVISVEITASFIYYRSKDLQGILAIARAAPYG